MQLHIVLAGSEKELLPQVLQPVAPRVSPYVPASHAMHSDSDFRFAHQNLYYCAVPVGRDNARVLLSSGSLCECGLHAMHLNFGIRT